MHFGSAGYKTLSRALAPLALDGRVHYLPNFECCRNCASARISESNWEMARGIVTFNEQMKEAADETGQLELIVHPGSINGGDEGMRLMAMLLIDAYLFQAGYRKVEENDPVSPGRAVMRLGDEGFLIFDKFRGRAAIDKRVQKAYGYKLS